MLENLLFLMAWLDTRFVLSNSLASYFSSLAPCIPSWSCIIHCLQVVSTSRTPGHTKHFQTIFLTANVRLCDCPGLVFPSVVGKQLQVCFGNIWVIVETVYVYSAFVFLSSLKVAQNSFQHFPRPRI